MNNKEHPPEKMVKSNTRSKFKSDDKLYLFIKDGKAYIYKKQPNTETNDTNTNFSERIKESSFCIELPIEFLDLITVNKQISYINQNYVGESPKQEGCWHGEIEFFTNPFPHLANPHIKTEDVKKQFKHKIDYLEKRLNFYRIR